MKNDRKGLQENINIILVTEVEGLCPRCSKPLMYTKNSRNYKGYEIAHIYPLKPSSKEKLLLKNEERLCEDVNNIDNLIPLCEGCHGKFDKPRTVEEYRELVKIKKTCIQQSKARESRHENNIESELHEIINKLAEVDLLDENDVRLSYEPKQIDQKANDTLSNITKNKIQYHVNTYFNFIKKEFELLDTKYPGISEIIATQIKQYYLKQKRDRSNQQEIFFNMVTWMNSKYQYSSPDACEVLISFFIQNCEVLS